MRWRASVEHPVRGAGWCGLEGEAGQRLVHRRRELAGRLVERRHGLLGLDPRTSTEHASRRLDLWKSRERPSLDHAVPGVVPGGGRGSAA